MNFEEPKRKHFSHLQVNYVNQKQNNVKHTVYWNLPLWSKKNLT